MKMSEILLRMLAARDLLKRYGAVLVTSWTNRLELESSPKLEHELAFLPASLELSETPVHPAPRWTMRAIATLAVIVVLIAIIGQLDIVATAKGKLVPNARVKIIQPAVTGVVRRILVQDGQHVQAGELLMELDFTQAEADTGKAHSAKVSAALAAARAKALLNALQQGGTPTVLPVNEATGQEQADAQRLVEGVYREYFDKQTSARAELARREAELQSTQHDIQRLKDTSPLAREEANAYKALVADKYVAKNDYLDKEQNALGQEHDLAGKISHAEELKASIAGQHAEISAVTSQFRREQLDALDKASQELTQDRDDETKATTRQSLTSISSPVSGTVQHLSIHTIGGVVTTAQTLMEIVPDDALEVEASVENKDIGFVRAGQEAIVKIESFPYSRYGYLHGIVRSVSNNAVQDNKQNLTFVTRVMLTTNQMHIQDQWINLTPGMTVVVEIRTGKRTVAGYFLDPLVQTMQESMHER
jgi:hemolysin D